VGLQILISNILLGLGICAIIIGTVGIFKFKNFYARLLITSKIDTVGTITIIIGLMVRFGFSFFTGKLLILLIVVIIVNPLVSHIVARSAYLSGHSKDEVESQEDDLE